MNHKTFSATRFFITILVTIAIWCLLAWNYFHGGVPSHHVLNDPGLPAISNWWGGLLLPVLTWALLYRVEIRIKSAQIGAAESPTYPPSIFYRMGAALLYGIVVAASFAWDYTDITGYLILAVLPPALFFPLYRAECLLGFVLGMSYTFGAVLPTAIGTILVLACAILYLLVRRGVLYLAGRKK